MRVEEDSYGRDREICAMLRYVTEVDILGRTMVKNCGRETSVDYVSDVPTIH